MEEHNLLCGVGNASAKVLFSHISFSTFLPKPFQVYCTCEDNSACKGFTLL